MMATLFKLHHHDMNSIIKAGDDYDMLGLVDGRSVYF